LLASQCRCNKGCRIKASILCTTPGVKKKLEGRAGQKGQKDRRGRGPYREYSAFSPNREAGAECRQNGENGRTVLP